MARALTFAARAVVGAYVAGSLLAWSARWTYPGELAASFTWHLALAGALLALATCLARRVRESLVALAVASVHALPFVPLAWAPRDDAPEDAARVRVVSANLLFGNPLQRDLVPWATFADADVLVFLELSPEGRAALEELRATHPHRLVHPAEATWPHGTWGLALLSRLPLAEPRAVDLGQGSFPALSAGVRVGGALVHVCAVHLPDPSSAARWRMRRAAMRVLRRLVEPAERTIVVGDLNVTTGSPDLADLRHDARLSDSRLGLARGPTWTAYGLPLQLGLDLDHLLVGEGLAVLDRRRLEVPGSDHCAVRAVLALR